jgi:hypothetical protein
MSNLRKLEEDEQARMEYEVSQDSTIAEEAERVAKEAEANSMKSENLEKETADLVNENLEWVKRSRPGAEAKPGAGLKPAKGSSGAIGDEVKNRDRIPSDTRNQQGAGSYFGESVKEKEKAAKAAEDALKAKEKDKISSGAGDRRREIEAKLNPKVRARAVAEAAKRSEEAKENEAWALRASIPRKFARPVERVLRIVGDENSILIPSMYSVLGVRRDVEEEAIKKAYRLAALRIHPGSYILLILFTSILFYLVILNLRFLFLHLSR